jgi:probable HAF family extracellular repeat protein
MHSDAGVSLGMTEPVYRQHAFLYSGGSIHDLGMLGGTDSVAFGVNATGQVTVERYNWKHGVPRIRVQRWCDERHKYPRRHL